MKCCCFNNTNNSNEKNEKISLPIWCYSVAIVKKRLLLLLWSVLSLALAHTQTHNADVLGIWIQSIAREWEEEFFHKRNVRANFCHLLDHTLVRSFARSLSLTQQPSSHYNSMKMKKRTWLVVCVFVCVNVFIGLFVCLFAIDFVCSEYITQDAHWFSSKHWTHSFLQSRNVSYSERCLELFTIVSQQFFVMIFIYCNEFWCLSFVRTLFMV